MWLHDPCMLTVLVVVTRYKEEIVLRLVFHMLHSRLISVLDPRRLDKRPRVMAYFKASATCGPG